MSTIDNGGPAFPVSTSNETDGHQDGPNTWQFPGMTLRDYFAAKAMHAFVRTLCDKNQMQDRKVGDLIATLSYIQADAMINARKPTP